MVGNRYERKRQHKHEIKKRHAIQSQTYDVKRDEIDSKEEYARDLESGYFHKWQDHRNDGYNYWDTFSLSGSRRYAKDCTNRKIRALYRDLLANENHENVMRLKGSEYEKVFDYWWTIY